MQSLIAIANSAPLDSFTDQIKDGDRVYMVSFRMRSSSQSTSLILLMSLKQLREVETLAEEFGHSFSSGLQHAVLAQALIETQIDRSSIVLDESVVTEISSLELTRILKLEKQNREAKAASMS